MPWIVIKALLGGGLRKLADLIARYPWQIALIAALLFAGWQARRADDWRERAGIEAANHRASKAAFAAQRRKWLARVAAAEAARLDAIRKSKEAASHAQDTFEALRADRDGLRAFIAANRLPSRSGERAVSATGAAPDHDPAIPDGSTTETIVAVRSDDLEACDDLYVYAFGAYQFTTDLRARGLALPPVQFGKEESR